MGVTKWPTQACTIPPIKATPWDPQSKQDSELIHKVNTQILELKPQVNTLIHIQNANWMSLLGKVSIFFGGGLFIGDQSEEALP